jgi:hypothetical protein
VTALLGWIVDPWWLTISAAIIAFWCLPLTPAVLLQLLLIMTCKKVLDRISLKIKACASVSCHGPSKYMCARRKLDTSENFNK